MRSTLDHRSVVATVEGPVPIPIRSAILAVLLFSATPRRYLPDVTRLMHQGARRNSARATHANQAYPVRSSLLPWEKVVGTAG